MKRNILAALAVVMTAVILATGALAVTRKKSKKKRMKEQTTAIASPALGPGEALVDIKTSEGDIQVLLFGDTPQHRDNFLKLVSEGYYDGLLFHRVINEFMVQTGDPESRNAKAGKRLGAGGPDYTLPAEIVYPRHFHKRGALAAARQGDQVNPERRSSGSQFYIVTGKAYNDSTLAMMEKRMQQAQKQEIFDSLARENRDQAGLSALQDSLVERTERMAAESPAVFTAEQRQAYATLGGSPHLDNQYTVFGEVVSGLDVLAKIENAETNADDRPLNDIKIISAKVVKAPK